MYSAAVAFTRPLRSLCSGRSEVALNASFGRARDAFRRLATAPRRATVPSTVRRRRRRQLAQKQDAPRPQHRSLAEVFLFYFFFFGLLAIALSLLIHLQSR